MSTRATAWAWQQRHGSPVAKFVLLALADDADEQGVTYSSFNLLSQKTGLSKRTIIDHLRKLEEDGFLRIERQTVEREHLQNRYVLRMSK